MHVIIIGAGIIGASAAYHLRQAGAEVTLVEARDAPATVATAASFSWINSCHGNPRPYFELRMASIERWRQLRRDIPAAPIDLCGGLFMELQGEALEESVATLSSWGYDISLVDREDIAELEPGLADPPEFAALAEDEGMVESSAFATMLIAISGARLVTGFPVQSIETRNGRAIGIAGPKGRIEADAVLVTAGEGTVQLLRQVGFNLPLNTPPGLILRTKPAMRRLARLAITPGIHTRQRADGSYLAGADFLGTHDIDRPRETSVALLESLRALVGDPEIEMEGWTIGHRPTPADGFPATGPVPGTEGLFVAVTHSGVTLAPALGDFLAAEIMTGEVHPLLARYRVQRFATVETAQA